MDDDAAGQFAERIAKGLVARITEEFDALGKSVDGARADTLRTIRARTRELTATTHELLDLLRTMRWRR